MEDRSGGTGAGRGSAPFTPAYQMAYFAHMQRQAHQHGQQQDGQLEPMGQQQQGQAQQQPPRPQQQQQPQLHQLQQQRQYQHQHQQPPQQQKHLPGQSRQQQQQQQQAPQRVPAPQGEHLLQYQQYFKQHVQQQPRQPHANQGLQAFQSAYGGFAGGGGSGGGAPYQGFPLMGGTAAAHFGAFGYQAPGVGAPPPGLGFGGAPQLRPSGGAQQEQLKRNIESELSAMIGIKPSGGQGHGHRDAEQRDTSQRPVPGASQQPARSGQSLLYSDTTEEQMGHLAQETERMSLATGGRRSELDGQSEDEPGMDEQRDGLSNGQKKKRRGGQKKKKGKQEKQEDEPIEYPPADPAMTGTFASARSARLLAKCPSITEANIEKVSSAVVKVHTTLRPPDSDLQKKKDLVKRLQAIVTAAFPNQDAEIHMFGSSANEFCLKKGDLDMCLTIDEKTMKRAAVIKKLAKVLETSMDANCHAGLRLVLTSPTENMKELLALPKARIPIVKFVDPRRKLSCDICVNNTLALENTRLLGDYASIDPRMRQLVFVVKRWAKQRGINDCYMRTLSSYAYVLLVIHFLQIQSPPVLPCLQEMGKELPSRIVQGYECKYAGNVEELVGFGNANKKPVGQLLIEFFKFYAYSFDYHRAVVSVRTGGFLTKEAKKWTQSKPKLSVLLTIEDPFEVTHNLGRSVDAQGLKLIREEFERAYNILSRSGNLWQVLEKYEDK